MPDSDALLGGLSEDDVMYDHPVSSTGEPMDPVLFVRWDAIRAVLAAAPPAPLDDHEAHLGHHEGYACGFSGPHCWACNEPWPCRTVRRVIDLDGPEGSMMLPDGTFTLTGRFGPEATLAAWQERQAATEPAAEGGDESGWGVTILREAPRP